MVRQVDGLCALQVRVAGHRPVDVSLGGIEQDARQALDPLDRALGGLTREEGDVGGHLVVARPRGVELAADRAGDLGEPPLDRHVDVLVVGREGERPLGELALDRVEAL